MSLICNTGRPPKDDALQNLTVNDTLRVNNLLKSTKAEIDRLCTRDQSASLVLAGSLIQSVVQPSLLDLPALPSGSTIRNVPQIVAVVSDFWYTSEDLIIDKFQVAALSTVAGPLNVAVGVTSDPVVLPTDVLTIPFDLSANIVNVQTDVSGTVAIPAGSYVTIHVTSPVTDLSDVRVSWTLHLNPQ
jgi:hypothetical protein